MTPQRAAAPGRGRAAAVTGQRAAGWSGQASGSPTSWAPTPLNGREAQCQAAPSRQPGRWLQGTEVPGCTPGTKSRECDAHRRQGQAPRTQRHGPTTPGPLTSGSGVSVTSRSLCTSPCAETRRFGASSEQKGQAGRARAPTPTPTPTPGPTRECGGRGAPKAAGRPGNSSLSRHYTTP